MLLGLLIFVSPADEMSLERRTPHFTLALFFAVLSDFSSAVFWGFDSTLIHLPFMSCFALVSICLKQV